jgi:hypothetical protein
MQLAGTFLKILRWLMTASVNQAVLTYLLELMYFMKYFVQAVDHVHAITQFYKKQLLAGQFLDEPQVSQHVTQHTFLLKEDSLKNSSNCLCEGEQVEQSTITSEQQACEGHAIIHTTKQSDGRPVVKLPSKMEPNQLGTSYLCRARITCI